MVAEVYSISGFLTQACIWALMLMCVLAAFLEWICLREKGIPDNELSLAGRRMLIAGLLLNTIRIAHGIFVGYAAFQPLGIASQMLIVGSIIVKCMNRLWIMDRLTHKNVVEFDKTGFFKVTDLNDTQSQK